MYEDTCGINRVKADENLHPYGFMCIRNWVLPQNYTPEKRSCELTPSLFFKYRQMAEKGVTMANYTAITTLAVCFCLPWGITTAAATAEKKFYEACFSAKVGKCLNKVRMMESKSCCRRQYGKLNIEKAIYYYRHKEALLDEMMAQKIKMKAYRVDYYLIRAFGKEMNRQAALKVNY